MRQFLRVGLVSVLALNLAVSEPAFAASKNNNIFGNIAKTFEDAAKSIDESAKDLGNNKDFTNTLGVLTAVGAGLVIGGVLQGNGIPAATGLAIGTLLVVTSPQFQREMARVYGSDWGWSGCTSCGARRVVTVPGRTITSEDERRVRAEVIQDIKNIQQALKALGLYTKAIDGDYGPGTKKGVGLFQSELNATPTTTLTADQRAVLFDRAANVGFVRDGYEVKPTLAAAVVDQSGAVEPKIKEFKLATSQFNKFAEEFLISGEMSSVSDYRLRGDGLIEITLDGTGENMVFGIEQVKLSAHDISDQWVRVVVETASGDAIVLNTVDTFDSAVEASEWINRGYKRVGLLATLSERNAPVAPQPVIIVANDDQTDTGKSDGAQIQVDQSESVPSGTIMVGTSPEKQQLEVAVQIPSPQPEAVASLQLASAQQCREAVYISFNFPGDDNPIMHYNISPPEGTLMMDNGDSTAYFAGNCVQGEYGYKYVFIDKTNENTYDPQVREGVFLVASTSEQCDVNLNDPIGSAIVRCF